jgi:predicted DCC family thiol-disulfide oxidoreductase YuxK
MPERALVLYDGDCPFCVSSVATLRRLDWLGALAYGNVRDEELRSRFPDVDPARLLQRLHLVTPGRRRVLDGFHAFRWIAGRLPLLWGLWPFLWIPGVAPLGARIYDAVARNRFAFGSCDSGAGGARGSVNE